MPGNHFWFWLLDLRIRIHIKRFWIDHYKYSTELLYPTGTCTCNRKKYKTKHSTPSKSRETVNLQVGTGMVTSGIAMLQQPRLTQFGGMSDDGGGDGGVGQRSHTPVLQVGVALDEHPLQGSLHVVHRGPAPLHRLQQGSVFVFPLLCFGEAKIVWRSGSRLTSVHGSGYVSLHFKNFMHRSDRRVPFGAQKTREFQGPTPSHFPK